MHNKNYFALSASAPSFEMRLHAHSQVVVLGSQGTGKSSLVAWLAQKEFRADYEPTVGVEFSEARCMIQGRVWNLQLWDAAGKKEYSIAGKVLHENAAAVVIVMDLTSDDSAAFAKAAEFVEDVKKYNGKAQVPILVVGSKADGERKVDHEAMARFIASDDSLNYVELSPLGGPDEERRNVAVSLIVHNVSSSRIRIE